MSYLRGINDRRQITLPPSVLREVGAGDGAYFTIHAESGRIVLEPREISERGLGAEDWKLLDRFVARQTKPGQKSGQSTKYKSPKAARKHLDRFR